MSAYAVTASSYEPFVRNLRAVSHYDDWFIERVVSDSKLAAHIERWRGMVDDDWDVTCLVAPDSKTVVAMGCRSAA